MTNNIKYLHYKELEEDQKYDVILAFQCTEHMPRTELVKFFDKMQKHLNKNGRLLIEFMTTTRVTKCHPFFDKFIFPDGAQFPLSTAIDVAEGFKTLRLKEAKSMDNDYYTTIKQWRINLEKNKNECIK